MKTIGRRLWFIPLVTGLAIVFVGVVFSQTKIPDVHYEPTPQLIVEELLKMAEVNRNDIVYDLGCGDGRFVITAAQKYGARGVGIDIDPERIRESHRNARVAGVMDRVKFMEGDLFNAHIREATVVAIYLLSELNLQLRPKLLREMKPGSRILSHEFDMYDWQPDKMGKLGRNKYYFWVVPADVAGRWRWSLSSAKGDDPFMMTLDQKFQDIEGKIQTPVQTVSPLEAYLIGDRIGFLLRYRPPGQMVEMRYTGRVSGNVIDGSVEVMGGPLAGRHKWIARR